MIHTDIECSKCYSCKYYNTSFPNKNPCNNCNNYHKWEPDVNIKKNDTNDLPASDKQIGGSHYKDYKSSPYKFFIDNKIPHHKAAIIRRILRYDHKTGGGLKDLQKIKHEVDLIIEFENW